MSHEECKLVGEWIDETIWVPVESFIAKQERICKQQDCNWWCVCCNKWFCWFVSTVVKIITKVARTIQKYVTHVVCEIVLDAVDFLRLAVQCVVGIAIGIFTLDWKLIVDSLVRIIVGVVGWISDVIRIAFGGDLIDFLIKEINLANLKAHVREKLKAKYRGEQLEKIKEAIGLDKGTFGLRLKATARRGFVSSGPALLAWHNDPTKNVDIKRLAGFSTPYFLRRFRPQIVDTTNGVTLGGGGGSPPSLSESQLDKWIGSGGTNTTKFIINSVTDDALSLKLRTASSAFRDVGVIIRWRQDAVELKTPDEVIFNATDGFSTAYQASFLKSIGRISKADSAAGATKELCNPFVVSVFYYKGEFVSGGQTLNGLTCRITKEMISGATFRDRLPDFIWKWVPAHELGHYFSLNHVDGLNNVMYSPGNSAWNIWLLPEYLYLKGEPSFSYRESKRVWDFIIDNFDVECLMVRHT